MPKYHDTLTDRQRAAFSALMAGGRAGAQHSLMSALDAGNAVLEDWGMGWLVFELSYVRRLEDRPAAPLSSPHRLSAMLSVYGLGWDQVLEVLEIDRHVVNAGETRVVGAHYRHGRPQPYTAQGITRLPCVRCGQPAAHQWQICADGRLYRPMCLACDVALNALVLQFVGDPLAASKVAAYRAAVGSPSSMAGG